MPEHVLASVRPVPLNPGEVFLAEPVMIAEEFLGPREGLESPAAEQDSRRVPVEPVRRSDGKSGIPGHGPEALRRGILMSRSGLRGQSGRLEDGHKAVLLSDDGEFRQILNRSLRLSGFPGHGLREGRNPHRIAFLHPGEGLHPPSVHAHLTRAYPAVQEALWQPEMALQKADDLEPGLFSAHSQAPALLPVRAVFFHQNILPAGQKPAVRHPIPSGGSGKEARSLRTLPFQGTMAAVRRMTSGPDFNQEFFPWLPLTAGA